LKTATNEFTSPLPVERANRILTPEQIHQIEAEVEAKMASASSVPDADPSSRYEKLPDMSRYTLTPSYATVGRFHSFGLYSNLDSQSVLQNQASGQDGSEVWTGEGTVQGGVEKTASRERTYDNGPGLGNTGDKKMEDSFHVGNNTDNYLNQVPTDALSGPILSDGVISMSAEAILRRVRSGSSLQIPLGVHLEEDEGAIGVENISSAGHV
jgi:hypothetical protein